MTVTQADNTVIVVWPDETGRDWRATFSLDPRRPLIQSITSGETVVVSGVRPLYQSETGTFQWEVDEGVEVTEAYWLAWKAFEPSTEVWQGTAATAETP